MAGRRVPPIERKRRAKPARKSSSARRATASDAEISSKVNKPGERVTTTVSSDIKDASGRVLIPAGSVFRGVVNNVEKAGRLDRKASLGLSFDQVTIKGRAYPIRATVTRSPHSSRR